MGFLAMLWVSDLTFWKKLRITNDCISDTPAMRTLTCADKQTQFVESRAVVAPW